MKTITCTCYAVSLTSVKTISAYFTRAGSINTCEQGITVYTITKTLEVSVTLL